MASTWSQGDWNLGSWNDAYSGASVQGLQATLSLGNVLVEDDIQAGWSHAEWGAGPWNQPGTSAYITGQQLNVSLGNITVDAELRSGWSRGTYSSATWNSAPDAFVTTTTVGELSTSINLGFGWSRESWNEGNWNSSLGFVFTGNGNVFATTTAGELTTTANNIVLVGQIMGGYSFGMEGALGNYVNITEHGAGRDQAFLKSLIKNYLGYNRDIPDLPEWDVSEWVKYGSYSSKGTFPLDRIDIHSRNQNGYLSLGVNPTWEDQAQWFYTVKKTIQLDAGSLGVPSINNYYVDAKFLNCGSTAENCEISINKESNQFTIIVKFEFDNGYQIPFASRNRSYQFFELRDKKLYNNFRMQDHRIKNVTFVYPTVEFSIHTVPKTNPGLTTPMGGANPLITL